MPKKYEWSPGDPIRGPDAIRLDKHGHEIKADHGKGPTRIVYDDKLGKYVREPNVPQRKRIDMAYTPEQAKIIAKALSEGKSHAHAARLAGCSKNRQHQGPKIVNRQVRAELKSVAHKYMRMGYDLTPEDQQAIVRGRLYYDVLIGSDKGVAAAKQLGADKRVSMWQPDSQVGLVVLQAPKVPAPNPKVPWLPVKIEDDEGEPPK